MSNFSDFIAKNLLVKIIFISIRKIIIRLYNFLGKVKFYSLVKTNSRVICAYSVELKYPENLIIGKGVVIGPECVLGMKSKLTIDDGVVLSKGVVLETAGLNYKNKPPYIHISKEIKIGKNTWIGTRAIILSGVNIGENCIVGAGTVVTKNIPNNMIAVGNPMKIISKGQL